MDIQDTKKQAFERFEDGSNIITDILDGSAYRAMMSDDGFLSKMKYNLTAVFNTDGVSLYSSSKIELWPIFLAINELSPQKRFSRDNILLVGLWQGKGKPPFQEFFQVFSKFMNPLYTDGVSIEIEGKAYTVKLSVVCGIADLPAKAELLNMSYFNGPNPCISCEEPGITVRQGRGTARCFPYKLQGTRCQSRTHESTLQHMESGTNRNRSAGFKGISGLSYLQKYNIVKGTVPDYMHGVLLGVTKSLMTKWFSPSQNHQEYFIGNRLNEISGRMKNLQPPESIERLPRDLEKHYRHLKATELQSWLLYYAFPCVKGLLKEEYLENLSCLSEGIHILLGDNITQESLANAIDLLDQFYSSFQRLYGDGSCGLNVHNTGLHLPEYVKLWGPVWAWSCFPFEDANSMLLQAVHGTGLVLKQVIKHRQAQSCIRRKGLDLKNRDGWKITWKASNCDVAGAAKPMTLDDMENEPRQRLVSVQGSIQNVGDLKKINRIVVNEKRFFSEEYSRMKKRICSVVLFQRIEIGVIKYFILCNNIVYAVIAKMEKIPSSQIQGARVASHYIAVRHTRTLALIDVESLQEILVYLDTSSNRDAANTKYVVQMPNGYGHAVFK